MSHEKHIGFCHKCSGAVLTVMDAKEHVVGEKLKGGWAQLWCSSCITNLHGRECICVHCKARPAVV